jgi:hypothetical protein
MPNSKRLYANVVKGERKIGGLFNWIAAYQEEDENLALEKAILLIKQGIYDVIFMKYFEL